MENNMKSNPENNRKNRSGSLRDYARYSNLAFRWIAVILVCFFGGWKLDQIIGWDFPVLTLVLSLSGLFLSMYLLIKDLKK